MYFTMTMSNIWLVLSDECKKKDHKIITTKKIRVLRFIFEKKIHDNVP